MKVNLTLGFLIALYEKQDGKCKYTGEKMDVFINSKKAISIDRIDSSGGYTIDNICLCAGQINEAKNDLSVSNFLDTCYKVNDYNRRNI